MMKCGFCGSRFDETRAKSGCAGCPMSRTCSKLKCPNCGYEVQKEPALVKMLKRRLKIDDHD